MIYEYCKAERPDNPPAWVSRQHGQIQQELKQAKVMAQIVPHTEEEQDNIMSVKAVLVMIGSLLLVLIYMLLAHDAALLRALLGDL